MSKEKTNKVSVVPSATSTVPSAESFITQAIASNASVETLERLFTLREKMKAEYAREAFDAAMSECQGDMPVIEKKKLARDEQKGKDLYRYAPMDDLVDQCGPIIAKHGFSYSFRTETKPEAMKVTIVVKHKYGHCEESSMETGLATKTQIMSGPQQLAATLTFCKRYAFMNAFGVTTGDEDTDAAGVDTKKIAAPKSDKAKIMFLLKTLKEKTDSAESIASAVKRLVQLPLEENNFSEIISRLEVIVQENHENTEVR